jgi:TM2 domain-containing membrane protein YozV
MRRRATALIRAAPYGRDPATGQPLSDMEAVLAGCLQLLFGVFGVGRFYIGSATIAAWQLGLGVAGLVLMPFLIGLPILLGVMVWALVDAVVLLTGSIPDNQGRKLR